MTGTNPYQQHLDRNPANYVPLTPLSFLARAARVYPERTSVIHGVKSFTWKETQERCRRLGSALAARGIGVGDTVAFLAHNTPEMYEAHFGVPMAGAVLNAINTRLDAEAIAFILNHGEAKILFTDREFAPTVKVVLEKLGRPITVIDIDDPECEHPGEKLGETDYEAFIAGGDPAFAWHMPADEWDAIALNYTSGTTGNPKGVVYHHRGAYLTAMSNAVDWAMQPHPVLLSNVPLFHCNAWCFPWTIAMAAGTFVCQRKVSAKVIYDAIADHKVAYINGAPIVLGFILNAKEEEKRTFSHTVNVMTAAAPPPASVLAGMAKQGFQVTHVYGLTETYGPSVVCAWKDEWNALDMEEQSRLKARQGVPYSAQEDLMVADAATMQPVPWDGQTMGEVFCRGNQVMKGYLKNPRATDEAFAGGWFHTGDLGVMHPDGYIQLKDRSKDIIISGGENISSIEVEGVLYKHPAVALCAVIAKPDEKWGETPCAFVELKPGAEATEDDIKKFCKDHLASFKCPRDVRFVELPKTSTGKIQKFILRKMLQDEVDVPL
ncbi:acyl-CoA synthetase [Novispirillum sp. DQ9]|uniref:acyl-CoA synthetase n=1 Tax=Novispirillum sp. DQ9 TaxID=3398612 RepID=UPI003C7C038F